MKPTVSVVIPAYNMASYLAESVRGVLNQTYQDFELLVVNDASTDDTDAVMRQFDGDERVRYLVHTENRYAAAARNTGIEASRGEFIAFLDADDLVHPAKLAAQVEFLERHPAVGLTYCSHIEIDQQGTPLALVPAAPTVSLAELVVGYPYAPSEVIMRREWVEKVGPFDESFRFSGEDPDFHMRVALHGCTMAGVKRVLNYRRLHAGRRVSNLAGVAQDQIRAFENTFANRLCPPSVRALRCSALGMVYRSVSFLAFAQNETMLGQALIRKAMELDGAFFASGLLSHVRFLARASVRSGGDHEAIIRRIVPQLPPDLGWSGEDTRQAVGNANLLAWARECLWGRAESGLRHLAKAPHFGGAPDDYIVKTLTARLLDHEEEFGAEAAERVCGVLVSQLMATAKRAGARKLRANFMASRAFRDHRAGEHGRAVPNALAAIASDASYLLDRGILAVLCRSMFGLHSARS